MKRENLIFIGLFIILIPCSFAQKIFKQVEKGNLEAVENYLQKGGDINLHKDIINYDYEKKEYPEKVNLLTYAVYYGHKDIAELLLSKKEQIVNYQDFVNQALIKASIKGELEICQFLLEKGAQLEANCMICHGRTPLQVAVGHEHWELAEYYFQQGANLKHIDNDGWNLLHLIACSNNTEWAKKMLNRGFDINVQNNKGLTPLMYAAGSANEDMFEYLLSKGAKTDIIDTEKDDLLMHAVHGGNQKIVEKVLVLQNNSIKTVDAQGNTPLLWAIWSGNIDLVKLLIEQGADVSFKIQGKTYLEHAKEVIKDKQFLNYLEEKVSK